VTTTQSNTRCGMVTLVGRPNVGKSTLLNSILGRKVSIVTYKPQTTRHQIQGIKTDGNLQKVFVDTPGLHLNGEKALNKYMNKTAMGSMTDVDVIVWVIDVTRFSEEDSWVQNKLLENKDNNIIIALNKIDLIKDKSTLLPLMEELAKVSSCVIPISAYKEENLDSLEKEINKHIPASPFYYPEDMQTGRNKDFHMSEIIREKLMILAEKEVPYGLTVEIEKVDESKKTTFVHALIWVEREGQKQIIIGKQGSNLKIIGEQARYDIERLLGKKICLKLWVKVKESWSNSPAIMSDFGYV
jgi:GTP-binding protein Era